MAFTPRKLQDGTECCSKSDTLCDACLQHFGLRANDRYLAAERRHLSAPEDPPNPYEKGLADRVPTLREFAESLQPGEAGYQPYGQPPDSYALHLAYQKAVKESK